MKGRGTERSGWEDVYMRWVYKSSCHHSISTLF